MCEGIVAFEDGDYSKAVELLYPIRYEIIKIGGSDAQVDTALHILFITCCLRYILHKS